MQQSSVEWVAGSCPAGLSNGIPRAQLLFVDNKFLIAAGGHSHQTVHSTQLPSLTSIPNNKSIEWSQSLPKLPSHITGHAVICIPNSSNYSTPKTKLYTLFALYKQSMFHSLSFRVELVSSAKKGDWFFCRACRAVCTLHRTVHKVKKKMYGPYFRARARASNFPFFKDNQTILSANWRLLRVNGNLSGDFHRHIVIFTELAW